MSGLSKKYFVDGVIFSGMLVNVIFACMILYFYVI
jgi:hypothetical protein